MASGDHGKFPTKNHGRHRGHGVLFSRRSRRVFLGALAAKPFEPPRHQDTKKQGLRLRREAHRHSVLSVSLW